MSDRHERKRAAMKASLEEKTGRSLDAWLRVLDESPAEGFMNRLRWLESEHGLGHFQSRLIVEEERDQGPGSGRASR